MTKPKYARCVDCNKILKFDKEETFSCKEGDICKRCHDEVLASLADQTPRTNSKRDRFAEANDMVPPPMFAEVGPIYCKGWADNRPKCAHYERSELYAQDGKDCAWRSGSLCGNPIAIVQALHAALARVTKEEKR